MGFAGHLIWDCPVTIFGIYWSLLLGLRGHLRWDYADNLSRYRIQFAVFIILLLGVYHEIIGHMMTDWYDDPNYSHGFLVPLIAGYFVHERWDTLKSMKVSPNNAGLFLILFGAVLLVIANIGSELYTSRSSLIVILAGAVLFFWGTGIFKALMLPLCFLIFMVPLPEIVYNAIAFPMKLMVAEYSVDFMDAIGIIVIREGNIIMFPEITLEVADACSGLRSLMSLITLAVAFSFFIHISLVKRVIIVTSAIPIAIFTNALRVIGTGILSRHYGAAAAEGFFHEFAGLLVFALAVVMLVGFGILLKKIGDKG